MCLDDSKSASGSQTSGFIFFVDKDEDIIGIVLICREHCTNVMIL